jgi:hypothetical protein
MIEAQQVMVFVYLHNTERFWESQRSSRVLACGGRGVPEFREPFVFSIYYAIIVEKVFLLTRVPFPYIISFWKISCG